MTEVYNSTIEDSAREGLLRLCAEALEVGCESLGIECLEKLIELDQRTCKEKLTELRIEINNLINVDQH